MPFLNMNETAPAPTLPLSTLSHFVIMSEAGRKNKKDAEASFLGLF
jgi:hypothetical protein